MTPDLVIGGLRDWIRVRVEQQYSELAGVQLLEATDAETFEGSRITISDTGSEEHNSILRGVLVIGIEVELCTVPVPTVPDGEGAEEEQASLEGTTKAQHKAMAKALYNILADAAAIPFLDSREGLKCFDIRNVRPTTTANDDLRAATFAMDVTACQL